MIGYIPSFSVIPRVLHYLHYRGNLDITNLFFFNYLSENVQRINKRFGNRNQAANIVIQFQMD